MRNGRRFPSRHLVDPHQPLNAARRSWVYGLVRSNADVTNGQYVEDLITGLKFATRNGTFSNGTTPFGATRCWNLAGSARAVSLPATMAVTQRVTLACWFRVDTSRDYWVFNKGTNDGVAATTSFDIGRFGGGNLLFRISDGATLQTCDSGGTYFDAKWHRVVATYDGTNAKIYVDGSLLATTASAATIPATAGNTWDWGVSGATAIGAADAIADMSVCGLAWSAQEVRLDFRHSIHGYRSSDGPLAWQNRSPIFDPQMTYTFSDVAYGTDLYQEPGIRVFADNSRIYGDATGFGPIANDGIQYFSDSGVGRQSFAGEVPTLVAFSDTGHGSDELTDYSPMVFADVGRGSENFTNIVNGNRRIIAQNLYRR